MQYKESSTIRKPAATSGGFLQSFLKGRKGRVPVGFF
jgi:hypothetical protein